MNLKYDIKLIESNIILSHETLQKIDNIKSWLDENGTFDGGFVKGALYMQGLDKIIRLIAESKRVSKNEK